MRPCSRPFRPFLELLEDRVNPGLVTVSFAAGTLTVTGGSANDDVTVSQPSFGQIALTSVSGSTSFSVNSANLGTAPGPFGTAASPVRNLAINTNLGNDTVVLNLAASPGGINLAGALTINLGSGGAAAPGTGDVAIVNSGGTGTLNVASLSVSQAAGAALVALADFNTTGSVTVNTGTAQALVSITRSVALTPPNNNVGGGLNVTTGIGADQVILANTDVTGFTAINLGTGDAGPNPVPTLLQVGAAGSTMTLNGGLCIQTASTDTGVDLLTVADVTFGTGTGPGGLKILTNGGDDTITVAGVTNLGGTSINTGAGNDSVNLDGDAAFAATFNGPFQMDTGAGDDTLEIGNAGAVDFRNKVSVQMGAGNDSLTLATTGPVGFSAGFLAVFDGGGGLTGGFNQKTVNAANVTGPLPQLLNFL